MPLAPVKSSRVAGSRSRHGANGSARSGRTGPEPRGLSARRAAAASVAATLATGTTLDEALARHRGEDDALARAIAVTTFRRFGTIRAAIAARLSKGMPTDHDALAILSTGAAQVLFLDVADHAAVDLSVRLASEGMRTRHLTGLVNALLRRLAREREDILADDDPLRDLPDGLAARWRDQYGADRTAAIAAVHRSGAALDVTCRSDAAGWAERLGGRLLPTGSVRLGDRRAVKDLPGYADGAWWIQDAAAALPARLFPQAAGARMLDMCAAPGGKTAQLAALGLRVTALDRSAARLERLRANMTRLGLAAEIVCADALDFAAEPFDGVLLDAPCTATGTIRRHPDIPWTKGAAELARLVDLQTRLLDRAADLVRTGGTIVYCVCSLEPEEGEAQADAFARRRPDFARAAIDVRALGLDDRFLSPAGDLRTVPDLWPASAEAPDEPRPGLDGFFAASFIRQDGRGSSGLRMG